MTRVYKIKELTEFESAYFKNLSTQMVMPFPNQAASLHLVYRPKTAEENL